MLSEFSGRTFVEPIHSVYVLPREARVGHCEGRFSKTSRFSLRTPALSLPLYSHSIGLERPVLVGWSYGGRLMGDYLIEYGHANIAGLNWVGAVSSGADLEL